MPQLLERHHADAAPRRPAHTSFPGWWVLLVQVGLVMVAALAYFGVRGLTEGTLPGAQGNARNLVEIERWLHLQREGLLQAPVVAHDTLITLANWIYIYGHWPVIIATLVWLFLRAPDRFYRLRNALFVAGAIGLVFFALHPVAPPRLGVLNVVDTVTLYSDSYRTMQPPGLVHRYAAFPSLHFGFNLLVGITLWQSSRNPLARAFAVLMPLAMAWAVIVTGNHYVVDVLAGGAVALTGLLIATLIDRVYPRPDWALPPRP